MITLRRAAERHHARRRRREVWLTFHSSTDDIDSLADGFGVLEILNEDLLPPGAVIPIHLQRDAEIVSYVLEGALAHEDSTGRSGVIHAGEFQRRTVGRGIRHSETNASRTSWAHVFQMSLHPSQVGREPSHEQRRFSAGQRRGVLCVVASPDGRRGSLLVQQDALIYSALLDVGQHVVHELPTGRSAWLHIVRGEVTLLDVVLTTGDGAGIIGERAVSLTAREETEILLVDLAEPPSSPRRASSA